MGDHVLITGGAGFIGSHTAVALLERGYKVRALDWLQPPIHLPGRAPEWLPDDVELQVGDVREKGALSRALRGVDAVIHLAAYQDYMPDFSTFFRTNTVSTALLYEIIVEERLPVRKVVIASSQAVYGEGRHVCPSHGDVYPGLRDDSQLQTGAWEIDCPQCAVRTSWRPTGESIVNPQNQYAVSKYSQEMVSFNLGRRYGIPSTCLRYSITQGRWQSPRNSYSGICRIFTLRGLVGKSPIVYEDGRQLRDYVHVGDVARANVLALQDSRTDYEAYNVGGVGPLSVLEFADVVRGVFGISAPAELTHLYRFGDTRHIVSDIGKLSELGWSPTLPVEAIVRDYADWAVGAGYADSGVDASIARMLEMDTLRRATCG
jgi:dTDP-L-rhamnose 4-epimerase